MNYEEYLEKLNAIVEVFNEYYGEDKVDLQNVPSEKNYNEGTVGRAHILVYFPSIKVTNEHGQSTIITDVYVKISIEKNTTLYGTFTINRSSYTYNEYRFGYVHSHLPSLQKDNPAKFEKPCLGRGPLNFTCGSLKDSYNLDIWRLFVVELDSFLQVESIIGRPYKSLIDINTSRYGSTVSKIPEYYCITVNTRSVRENIIMNSLIKDLINNKILKYSYNNGLYNIAMSYLEILIAISDRYIKLVNSNKITYGHGLLKCYQYNRYGHLEAIIGGYDTAVVPNTVKICTFKDKDVMLNVGSADSSVAQPYLLLDTKIINIIVTKILTFINANYGKSDIKATTII